MKFMENTKINFMKFKTIGFGLSSAMAIGSILLLLMGVNLGIDFKGGTAIGVSFSEDISIEEIRSSLKTVSINDTNFDLSAEEIKYFGSNSDVMIKIKTLENEPENFGQLVINHLYGSLNSKVPENKNDFILSLGSVSPKVGSELSGKALWSVISALVLILFYISVRFEFRFALGAILALVHDVIITLGIFSLTGFEITLSTVAAFLTIVGYSLNDTIVILDRIRENMKSSGTVMFESTINKSINQSLSRTLITSLTTLLVIIVLLIYGGEVIRPFSFTMLVGVIIGTYSSIYIASALLATIYQNSK
jgi:preprotein translocase SecF subunit|tara:strand:- start:440 stop:1360 length:921 start_codon:yes stop_codon:yes gene_type:complete